ncbi:Tol-Pal system protein TolB [Usitatibacter rugosus]|uniref:Tol-Pal system protein TolB n=1 Tax=Usitatibacter rugosus TaxID=2732067 RepID=A0A6M4GUZ1_9PROT|nr:Tol-Pal system protein TolB [Usitatibacter rugosus]
MLNAPAKSGAAKAGEDNTATFVRDQGDVAIIELTGNYDASLAGGAFNVGARQVLAREFLRTHPDAYDMLVVFTGFPIQTGEALAFHHPVRNQVMGIGRDLFDNSSFYGSAGRLQGMIDMALLTQYSTDSMSRDFEQGLMVFSHEFMHQFGSYVKYRKADGSTSTGLLGRDASHWSYLLETNGSVMYGSRWRDNGDGTFTSVAVRDAYSALDLYLMGLKRREDVPPFFVIDAPGVDPTQLPLLGATVTGTKRIVTVEDIIAVEGPRIPEAGLAQKDFRLAFIYAVRPGQQATITELAAMDQMRRALATRFSALTGGVGNLNVFVEPALTLAPGTPATLPPSVSLPAPTVNVQQGITWLRQKQSLADGSWSDTAPTAMRDSAVALSTLSDVDSGFAGIALGAGWLSARTTSSVDFLARKTNTLAQVARVTIAAPTELLAAQNPDGGWGSAAGYGSNPLDTALALQALMRRAQPLDAVAANGFTYLRANQNTDGGWGNVSGGASRSATSAHVLVALQPDVDVAAVQAIDRGRAFLASRQNTDGGFGDSPSSIHDTGNVVAALMATNASAGIRLGDAMTYLASSQRVDGSWAGSVYSTALAVNVLARADALNWAIVGFTATPGRASDGQRVVVTVTVRNTGNRATPAGKLRVSVGDPSAGGVAIGPDGDIPALAPGLSAVVPITWNTFGKAGTVSLYAVVDPDRLSQELSVADNTAILPYAVDPPATGADLLVAASDITFSPARPAQLPAPLQVSALLTNAGFGDAANVKVVLWEGTGAQRVKVGETTVASFTGRSTRPVTFPVTLVAAGTTSYTVQIDPDNAVAENAKDNNEATATISTEAGIDIEVTAADISRDKPAPRNGEDVNFSVRIRNKGTVATPDFTVRHSVDQPVGTAEAATNTIRLLPGQQVTQSVTFRVTQNGAHTYRVQAGEGNEVVENNKANNVATHAFTVASDTGPSLSISFPDITATPNPALEGLPLVLTARIRNLGDQPASNVQVAFYNGDPATGGTQIGDTQVVASLPPSTGAIATVTWSAVPDANQKVLFVVVDPANAIPGDVVRADNKAFIVVPVRSLPDLAISTGNLTLTPALPQPGAAASLAVKVQNLGVQAANNVLVRVFDGNPAAGGTQVGGDQVIAVLEGQATATATFNWTFPAASGDRVLYVQVDPLQAINERVRTNNEAQLVVGVQTGDFTVQPRYFSPNGDGAQDTVDFTFRVGTAQALSIQVMSSTGTVVRHYTGTELANASAGRWSWDGRNDTGSVVFDDTYRIQVVAAGVVVGEASVVLDTNRSSLVDALGTPDATISSLDCQVSNEVSWPRFTADLSYAYSRFGSSSSSTGDLPAGIYRTDARGGDLRQVAANDSAVFWTDARPSPDGTRLALARAIGLSAQLWIANADGSGAHDVTFESVFPGATGVTLVTFNLAGTEVVIVASRFGSQAIITVPVGGGPPRLLATGDAFISYSPDRTRLLVRSVDAFAIVEVATGARHAVQTTAPQWTEFTWSPDSRALVTMPPETTSLLVFDAAGVLQRTIALPLVRHVHAITWGDDSSQIFVASGDDTFCNPNTDCNVDAIIQRIPVLAGDPEVVLRVPGGVTSYGEANIPVRLSMARLEGRGELLVSHGVVLPEGQPGEPHNLTFALSTSAPYGTRPLRDAARVVLLGQFEFRNEESLDFGRAFLFNGDNALTDNPGQCLDPTSGSWLLARSLRNLTADLLVVRNTTAVRLVGTAWDANFSRYTLEYANVDAPGVWQLIAPVSTSPVRGGDLASWVPPLQGRYLVRLTVQDLAGNRREAIRSVNWGAGTVISSLQRSNEYISPNGDGVKDGTTLSYRVLEPTNLEFSVFDAQGGRVRVFTRNHPVSGIDASVEWDGRDTAGNVVADGTYRITVLDYEFPVTVDTKRPVPAGDATTMARMDIKITQIAHDNDEDLQVALQGGIQPHVRIDWAIAESHLARIELQAGDGDAPTEWLTVRETNRLDIRTPYEPVIVTFNDAARKRYRLVVTDLAGNVSIEPLTVDEKILVTAYHGDGEWHFLQEDKVSVSDLVAGMDLEVVETVRAITAQWAIEYQGPYQRDNEGKLPPPNAAAWTAHVLVPPFDTALFTEPHKQPLDGAFLASWDLKELGTSGAYYFRLRSTNAAGGVVTSNAILFESIPKLLVRAVVKDLIRPAIRYVSAEESVGELLQRVDLYVQAEKDPFYSQERKIATRPGAPTSAGLGRFTYEIQDRLQTCVKYKFRLEGTAPNGKTFKSAPFEYEDCKFVQTYLEPVEAQTCGAIPPGRLVANMLVPGPIIPDTLLTLLEFGRKRTDGTDDILFSKVNPQLRTPYPFEFSTAALPEGELAADGSQFFTRLTDLDGNRKVEGVRVVVDRTVPESRITYPVAEQRVCAVQAIENGKLKTFLDIQGSTTDPSGVDYVIENGVGASPTAWNGIGAVNPGCFTASNANRAVGKIDWNGIQGNSATYLPPDDPVHCGAWTALAAKDVQGTVGRWYNPHGSVSARLVARNWGGYKSCSQVAFFVDGRVEVQPASLSRTRIAPGRPEPFGITHVRYTADESVKLTLLVYRKADVVLDAGRITGVLTGRSPIRTLADRRPVIGEGTVAWDGRDDGATLVDDGEYVILTSYEDDCTNLLVDAALIVQTDRTPPVVSIASPLVSANVTGIVGVTGSVSDASLEAFVLEFGSGASPETWTAIASGAYNVPGNGSLGSWTTLGLDPGVYTLRLRASDLAGNAAETRVSVTVQASGTLVADLEAVPAVFSPNGDGKADLAAIRFSLNRTAQVTLRILQGTLVVRTLANGVTVGAGDSFYPWDGRNDGAVIQPDGRFEAELTVNDGGSNQTLRVPITIDNTPPQVTIVRPSEGYVRGAESVVGSIADANLLDYSVLLRGLDAPISVILDEGGDTRSNYPFGQLSLYPEGRYELEVIAHDRAQNTTRILLPFVIDNVAPQVAITAPAAQAVLGMKGNKYGVTGTVDERNLLRYRLNLGQGPPPAPQTELATGSVLAAPIHQLDITNLPDGAYQLQLIGEDRAGWSTTATVPFIVDKTPPVASFSAPAEASYVKAGTEIRGSATDTNLKQYKLEIAPGPRATASRFTELATGTSPVSVGVLTTLAALPPDGVHTLRLTVTDKAENETKTLLQVTVDTVPPPVPLNLAARVENRQDVVLTWNAVTDPDLAGYRAYRGTTLLTPAPITATTFTEVGVAEGDHSYTVTAVDRAGNESARSAPAIARVSLSTPIAQITFPTRDSTVTGVIEIRGSAFSPREFKEFRVSVGVGAAPASYTLLRHSTVGAQGEVLATWNASALPQDAQYTIRLEAEDTFGAIGRDLVTVRIDNLAPAAPTNLQAAVAGADITLTWNANTEPDIDGYLLYRNGQLANLSGPVAPDIRAYLIHGTTYVDRNMPDGTYKYTVVAVDTAGNQSPESEERTVVLESRVPKARIVKPLEGARIDASAFVQAATDDNDVQFIQLQFRKKGVLPWTPIGGTLTAPPYGRDWDLSGLVYGEYEVSAVAHDFGGRFQSDLELEFITINHTRVDRPPAPANVVARVAGDIVTLTWNAVTTDSLGGYTVYREDPDGSRTALTPDPISALTYVDGGLADGVYRYTVVTSDTFGNLSDPSAPATARVYGIEIEQPYTPTDARTTNLSGTAVAGSPVTLTVTSPGGGTRQLIQGTDAQGRFTFANIALELGNNGFVLVQTDAVGNTSRDMPSHVRVGDRPSVPTGLAVTPQGLDARVTWNANPEANLGGYILAFDGEPVTFPATPTYVEGSTEEPDSSAQSAVDGDTTTAWRPAREDSKPTIKFQFDAPRLLKSATILWSPYEDDTGITPATFILEGWDGEVWVPLAVRQPGTVTESIIALDQPYLTDALRIRMIGPRPENGVQLSELTTEWLQTSAASPEIVSGKNGNVSFSIRAYSAIGLVGAASPAVQATVGDTTPPQPVVLQLTAVSGRNATLSWAASASTDVSAYYVYTNGDFTAQVEPLPTTNTFPLEGYANGEYRFRVVVVDQAGNESVPSNEVVFTVSVNPTGAPRDVVVTAVPSGRALDVSWNPPATGSAPVGYVVERALQSGGPYDSSADAIAPPYRDEGLTNGTRYYYRVRAVNDNGDRGPASAEASGVPSVAGVPLAPTLMYPGSAARTGTISSALSAVTGFSEPGTQVALVRDGSSAGTAVAATEPQRRFSNGNLARFSPNGYWSIGGDSDADLYAMAPSGETRVRTFNELKATAFAWAGNQRAAFVFYRFVGGNFVKTTGYIDVDGTEVHALDSLVPTADEIQATGDGRYAYVIADNGGHPALWRMELATNIPTLVVDLPGAASVTGLALSPNEQLMAYRRDGRIEVANLQSGTVALQGPAVQDPGVPSWTMDNASLLYSAWVGGIEQVFRQALSGTAPVQLTTGTTSASSPTASPDGVRYAYVRGFSVFIAPLDGGTTTEISDFLDSVRWLPSGYIATEIFGTPGRMELAGFFAVPDVLFRPGINRLTATANYEGGLSSAVSAAALVNYSTADRADLSVSSAELVAIPGVPTVGESVRITALVRNVGPRGANAAPFVLQLVDPTGAIVTLVNTRLPQLASGALQSYVVDWMPARAGAHRLVATVDHTDEVNEVTENNNVATRDIVVAEAGVPRLEVTTDARVYPQNAAVAVEARITNGGTTFNGVLELVVEDPAGFPVTTFTSQAVSALDFGQTLVVQRAWNTGSTLPGPYRVRAKLRSGAGVVVAEANTPITVDAPVDAAVTLTTDRAQYSPGATVRVLGRVAFANGAGVGITGDIVLRIYDAVGSIRFEQQRSLAFGATADVNVDWPLAGQPAGDYTARLELRLDGRVIAAASTAFSVVAVTLQPPTVAVIAPANNAVFGAPGRIGISVGASSPNAGGSIAKVEYFAGTTKLGESLAAPYTYDWTNIPAGTYAITAIATDNRGVTSTSTAVSVIVDALPTVAITAPVNGAQFSTPATVSITAQAQDSDGTIARLEIYAGTLKLGECLAASCTVSWNDVPVGSHGLTAVAFDNHGARGTSSVVTIVVGQASAPPSVSLTSPLDGAVAQAPGSFALSASASSPNAGGSIQKVEYFTGLTKIGESATAPYAVTWSALAAGTYTVFARVTDDRGVTADSVTATVFVNAAPTAAITSPAAGATFTAPAAIAVTATGTDTDGNVTKIEIFQGAAKLGECASTPCTVTWTGVGVGSYSLTAVVTDNRGGVTASAAVSISVVPPLQPPVVALTAPANGALYQALSTVALAATASSPNAGGSITKVEFFRGTDKLGESLAAPFTFSWTNVAAGTYTLTARATDNRGVATDSAPVSINVNAQPAVAITAPAANAAYLAPTDITITATAQDSDGSITKIEIFSGTDKRGECATSPCTISWTAVPPGTYSLTAKATDDRGGTATTAAVPVTVGVLTGTVSVTPTPADIGTAVQINARAQSPAAATGLPLRVRVLNAANATVSEWDTTATLVAGVPFIWAFSWDTTGQAAGTYTVAFYDRRTGSNVVLATTTLTLRAAGNVQLSVTSSRSRVLVLAACHTPSGNNDPADAACALQRKAALESLLAELGIPGRVVTDADTFRTEMRCGTWNTFWIAGGREKLKDRMVEELAQRVYAGDGLLVDGVHDGPVNTLDPLLGVNYLGKLALNGGYSAVPVGSLIAAGFTTSGRASQYQALPGTTVHAAFGSAGGNPALMSRAYGLGWAGTAAFDYPATIAASASAKATVLPMLRKVLSGPAAPGTSVNASLVVTNGGTAGPVTVQATVPSGISIASSVPAASGSTWNLNLAANESRTIAIVFNLTGAEASYTVPFTSGAATANLVIDIAPHAAGTHSALVTALQALVVSGAEATARNNAVQFVNQSSSSLSSDPEAALYKLLDAAKEVAKIANPIPVPTQLARLANQTSAAWCGQVGTCMRPDQGVPSLGSYQLLVFGDATLFNGSTQGAVGISGNAQLTSEFVGTEWAGDAARLNVGGNLNMTNGSIGRNSTGAIRVGGTMTLSANVGRRTATAPAETEDWAALETFYRARSDSIAALGGTAPVTDGFGKFTLTGTNADRNVFQIAGSQMTQIRNLVFNVPLASTVIVNVTGGSATLTNGSQSVMVGGTAQSMAQHPFSARVLFNFAQAGSLSFNGWALQGSLLAPRAVLSINNGQLFGQLVVDGLTSSGVGFQQCGTFKGVLP